MPTPRIVTQVKNCGECPHHSYYSGDVYNCRLVDQPVRNKHEIAPFCPLPEYPAHTIANMEATIAMLRAPYQFVLGMALLSHVATKLKRNLEPSMSAITIVFMDGKKEREVRLQFDHIQSITALPSEIVFLYDGGTFKLAPDTNPPILWERIEHHGQEYWNRHELR